MATEAAASPGAANRPRPLLLILLGIVVVAFLVMQFGGSSAPPPQSSNAVRPPPPQQAGSDPKIDPAALDVQLEALESERPGPGDTERNPFRFQARTAPPPPASTEPKQAPRPEEESPATGLPPPPPPPPPITVKFIGKMDLADGTTMAIFTDCTVGRTNIVVREGQTILGQYRLVKIGLESVVVEHLDGRGRTTLPKSGQECVK
jgi:hypothetical protein